MTSDVIGRWGRAAAVVTCTGLAATLAACSTGGTDFTPKPVVTISPSPAPRPSTPVASSASPTPTATPTPTPTTPGVKASGTLGLFMTVTKALAGTCQTTDGTPTITLADHDNDFYGTVDATIALAANRKSAGAADVAFGEDSEGFTWKLSYNSAKPVAGTSAKVVVAGNTYTLSGKLQAVETRKGKTRTDILPFRLVATCASADW